VRPKGNTADEILARLAARSHGVVTRAELLGAGVTQGEIRQRVQAGALLRQHRGVYRVGHAAPLLEATYLAAVRACGEGALLSHRAAGHLYRLLPGSPPTPHVSVLRLRRVPGVETTRRRAIDRRDAAVWRDIPITTVPATLVDLAGALTADELARACHQAEVLHQVRPAAVERAAARRPGAAGAAKLRAVMEGDEPITLSALERRFLERLAEASLPPPQTNRRAGSYWVDCRWPGHRLTVELDSYRFHHSRHAWERDHARERAARARGDDYRRYTHADVFEDPGPMLAELRALLQAAH
jgi:very-short-patch-repair endonuclease